MLCVGDVCVYVLVVRDAWLGLLNSFNLLCLQAT